jgi:colanic acid biosynthesis glycosyl transferase WcaI
MRASKEANAESRGPGKTRGGAIESDADTFGTVLFLEQYYYPEGWGGAQLPRDVTVDWARAGYRVAVVCGSEQYARSEEQDMEDPRSAGVVIRRIPALVKGDVRRRKVLRQAWFLLAVLPAMVAGARPDVLVTQTNPPVAVLLTAVISRLRRRPYVIIAQDLYPEVIFAHGMLSRHTLLGKLLTVVFARAYGGAAAVVSLGPRMTSRLVEKGVTAERVWQIPNWATGDLRVIRGAANELRRSWNLEGKFVVLYSGNLGVAHDCETLLRAVAISSDRIAHLRLVFIGGGTRSEEARKLVHELKLERIVLFKPFVPFALLPQTYGLADLSVVTLLPGFDGLVVPSKLLGNMARGVPTLYIGPPASDVDIWLQESGGGVSIANGDADAAAECLTMCVRDAGRLEEFGAAARRFYDDRLRRELALDQYRHMLSRTLAGDGPKEA